MTEVVEYAALATDMPAEERQIALDPFAYVEGYASRIRGLGGTEPFHDPAYAFHTPYVPVNNGPARFTLHFRNLEAKKGTLAVRIGMHPQEPGAQARLVDSERITFNRLIQQGGTMSIAFEGYRNVHFAVLGHIFDATDAAADALDIVLEQSPPGESTADIVVETRSTSYGADAARPVAKLVSPGRASFADPVSQLCTRRQFDEAPYKAWAKRLGETPIFDRHQWERLFVMQALARYGMLADGAAGLGFRTGGESLAAAMAASGISVVATDPPGAGSAQDEAAALAALRRPGLCDDATFDRHVTYRPALLDSVPTDLVNFDFLWSSGALDQFAAPADGIKFVERAMACLRPGGVAVHTGAFDASSNGDSVDGAGAGMRRRDFERLGLMLIARGHEVAQLRLGAADMAGPHAGDDRGDADAGLTSFGVIARKAASPFL